MAGLPPAPRPTVTAFEAVVDRVQTSATLADADKAEILARTRELSEHVRTDIQNKAYILRVILRIDVALHALHASPPNDPRVVALHEARRELELRANGTMGDRARSAVSGYTDAARDSWNSGAKPLLQGRPVDTSSALTSAALLAGGVALGYTAVAGTLSAVTSGPDVQKPTIGQRIRGFFGKLITPLLALGGFFMLGNFSSLRAAARRTPELREERSYLLDQSLSISPPIRGMTFRRSGSEVLVEKGGSQYRMIFENAPGLPPPSGGEETLGSLIERMYSSGSTGSGLGIERGGFAGRGSIGGVRTGESFILLEAGVDNIRAALESPDAALPAGALANVPLKFNLSSMTPSQMAFVRRCIARGATLSSTDDGVLTVTVKLRLKRSVAAPPLAPVLATLDSARNLGNLRAGTYAYGVAAGATVEIGPVGVGAVAVTTGMTQALGGGVRLKRTSDTRLELEILPGAAPGTTYTFRTAGNNISFTTEAAPATPADTVLLLNDASGRARVLAGEMAAFADAGLAAHAGSPETFAAFANKITELNNLIPAAHRADAGVRAAVDGLLGVGTPVLRNKRLTTSTGTYKIISRNGQLSCELVPVVPPAEILDTATARNNLVVGTDYRIALPATARRAIVSTRNLAGNGLGVDNTVDSFVSKPVAWTTYSAIEGPVDLSVDTSGATHYLVLRPRRRCTFRIRFDVIPVAAGDITVDYTVP